MTKIVPWKMPGKLYPATLHAKNTSLILIYLGKNIFFNHMSYFAMD